MPEKTDLFVLGGGPGGYHAAIRAAQLGLDVTCVDEGTFGGVCLHRGCIPSKGLIGLGKLVADMKGWSERGLAFGEVSVDLEVLQAWKQKQIDQLAKGVQQLMKGRGVNVVTGSATLTGPNTAAVDGATVEFDQAILAPGSRAIELPHIPYDNEVVIGSRTALELTELPSSMLVIGGGFIGLEIGQFYHQLGTEVTVVEMMPSVLPTADADLGKQLARELKKQGIDIQLETKAAGAKVREDGASVELEGNDGTTTLDVDKVLVAVGRKPRTDGIGLEDAGVKVNDKGLIEVDERMRTSQPHIFAIGDAVPGPALAHKASHEGVHAAAVAAGNEEAVVDYRAVPWFCYTTPEVASVGLTEAEAREQYGDELTVAQFPFAALGKAKMKGHPEGWAKVIADAGRGAILGVHIIGADATSIIAEPALAIEMGATLEDIAETIHAHPTLPEVFLEAAEVALGHPIHVNK